MFTADDLAILFQDEHLLVVDKPSGLPSLPAGYDPLAPHLKALLEPLFGRLWIVHRLDKETSGVIVLARNAEAHRHLNTQFERHTVRKVYHALVHGLPAWQETTARQPLLPNGDRRHRTVVSEAKGKPAVTHFHVLQRFSANNAGFALLEARPETGRTHQIRTHLYALGLPIAGDLLYGGKDNLLPETPPEKTRSMLHAYTVELAHPVSGERMTFTAPYPQDFKDSLSLFMNAGGARE